MAYLFKPKMSSKYSICWTEKTPEGRLVWHRKSTGESDIEKAYEILKIFQAAQQKRETKATIDAFLQAAGCETIITDCPLPELWQWYLDHCEVSGESRQIRDRHNALDRFTSWVAASHPEIARTAEITLRVASEYWQYLAKKGDAPSTRNNNLSALNTIWKAIHAPMELQQNPWAAINRDTHGSIPYQPFTPDELRKLRDAAANYISQEAELDFWPTAIEMGYYTGLRLGDIATLSWEEIQADEDFLILIPNKTRHWGDDRVAVHSLNLPWVAMLPDPPKKQGSVWPKATDAYQRSRLSAEFTDLARKAGITLDREPQEGERRNQNVKLKTFHSLRHTFATEMLKAGLTETELRDQGNWSGTDVIHGHYNHAKMELAKNAARKIAKAANVKKTE